MTMFGSIGKMFKRALGPAALLQHLLEQAVSGGSPVPDHVEINRVATVTVQGRKYAVDVIFRPE